MDFVIDLRNINNKKLINAIQQLYFSFAYYKIERKFPDSNNILNPLCNDFFQKDNCSKCPLETIYERHKKERTLCYYLKNRSDKVIKDIPDLVKRLIMIASGERNISNILHF